MTWEQFRRALVMEQYAEPVAEWHPPADALIAAAERNELLDAVTEQEQTA